MIISPHVQGSQDWLNARSTVITASMMGTVMAKGRGSAPSITRTKYMRSLANSIVTGNPVTEGFKSGPMQEGNLREPESRDYYGMLSRNTVEQVGLIYLDENRRIGASVDGLINADGNLELKNPNLETHLGYLLDGGMPAAYVKQVQTQLWVTKREYCDFVSYHPDAFKMLYRFKVERDEDLIRKIKTATYLFIAELDQMVETFKQIQEGE